MKEEETRIYELLSPLVKEQGYEIASLSLSGGKSKTLSVVVDRVEPISMEDIVALSGKISDLLDEKDPIEAAYMLDVSSLGAEKPIQPDRLGEYAGRYVNLHLSHPYKGENVLEGTLLRLEGENLVLLLKIKTRKLEAAIPLKDVDKARLAIEF